MGYSQHSCNGTLACPSLRYSQSVCFRWDVDFRWVLSLWVKHEANKNHVSKDVDDRIQEQATFAELFDTVDSTETCFNTLDLLYSHGSTPYSIRELDENHRSLRPANVGKQSVRMDQFLIMEWAILTQAGFLTEPHNNANGCGTWMLFLTLPSEKIWVYGKFQDTVT